MPFGLVAIDWDEPAQTVTLRYVPPKANLVFSVSDIPQNIQRTVNALQTWCDANLQTFMVNKGLIGFIKVKVRQVTPTIKFDFVVSDTQVGLDEYIFPDLSLIPIPTGPH
jgi:hypothetical protein